MDCVEEDVEVLGMRVRECNSQASVESATAEAG